MPVILLFIAQNVLETMRSSLQKYNLPVDLLVKIIRV